MTATAHCDVMERDPGGPALDVESLTIGYPGSPDAVSDVSVTVAKGEILGIIGESGCGKSSVGLSLLGLLPASATVRAARMTVAGHDLVGISDRAMSAVRGNDVAMIFQEPMNALNPVMRIGDQIAEVLRLHGEQDRTVLHARSLELLQLVHVPEPELRLRQFPHQISGGMRQRVVIAIAMAARPALLVADEPTTALDVTVQAQILELLQEMRDRTGAAVVLISHDLGVIAQVCDRLVVMYAGQVVEEGTPDRVLTAPRHPYTAGLLRAVPSVDRAPGEHIPTIQGGISEADRELTGCRFASRCELAMDACADPQQLRLIDPSGHRSRCVLVDLDADRSSHDVGGQP